MTMTSQLTNMKKLSNFFDAAVFLLSSLVTHPSLISISLMVLELWSYFVYMGFTRHPEIGNTPVWVLPNIWRLGQIRDMKFGANVSDKKLLTAAKCQGYSFYRFWFIKRKPAGGKTTPQHNQIRVKLVL